MTAPNKIIRSYSSTTITSRNLMDKVHARLFGFKTRPQDPNQPPEDSTLCPLLDLPAELRDRIYHLALLEENMDRCLCALAHGHRTCKMQRHCTIPPLMHACHQIRGEASQIWLHAIRVHYRSRGELYEWVAVLTQKQFERITYIHNTRERYNIDLAEKYLRNITTTLRGAGKTLTKGVLHLKVNIIALNVEQKYMVSNDPTTDGAALVKANRAVEEVTKKGKERGPVRE